MVAQRAFHSAETKDAKMAGLWVVQWAAMKVALTVATKAGPWVEPKVGPWAETKVAQRAFRSVETKDVKTAGL